MSLIEPEERPYTTYQRRLVISRLMKKFDCDIFEATNRFKHMENTDLAGLAKLVANLKEAPNSKTGSE